MTEEDIERIIKRKRKYEIETAILRDCVDDLNDPDRPDNVQKYAILKRRVTLIEHWLAFLPHDEQMVISNHLIGGRSWNWLANYISKHEEWSISCDERTLQRIQNRGIRRIYNLVTQNFGDDLDYLIDQADESP